MTFDQDCVFFLKNFQNVLFCPFPGLDYVSHDDILPYTVSDSFKPIHHELFDKFFYIKQGKGEDNWSVSSLQCFGVCVIHIEMALDSFTPKNDQFQISAAASPET